MPVVAGFRQVAFIVLLLIVSSAFAGNEDLWSSKALASDGTIERKDVLYSPPARDNSGNTVVLWTASTVTSGSAIYFSRSDGLGGDWTTAISLHPEAIDGKTSETSPVVSTDKTGNWIAVWASNYSIGGSTGDDFDILVSRSTDAGGSWTTPSLLNSDGLADTGEDISPWLATDEHGNWITVWQSDHSTATLPGSTTVVFARSTDNGVTWSDPNTIDIAGGKQTGPQISAGSSGSFIIAWTETHDEWTTGQVKIARTADAGHSWKHPVQINLDEGNLLPEQGVFSTSIAGNGHNNWIVAWGAANASNPAQIDLYATTLTDQYTSSPSLVFENVRSAPRVSASQNGEWFIGYVESYLPNLDTASVATSGDFGASWHFLDIGMIEPYLYASRADSSPWVWKTNDSQYSCVFSETSATTDLLIGQTRIFDPPDTDVRWSDKKFLTAGTNANFSFPAANPDIGLGEGEIMVVVCESSALAGSPGDSDIAYFRALSGGISWEGPFGLNSDWRTDNFNDTQANISGDGQGRFVCTWVRNARVYVSASFDNGISWRLPAPIPTIPEQAHSPAVTWGEANAWHVAYSRGSSQYVTRTNDLGRSWNSELTLRQNSIFGCTGAHSGCERTNYTNLQIAGSGQSGAVAASALTHSSAIYLLSQSSSSSTYVVGNLSNDGGADWNTGDVGIAATDRFGNWGFLDYGWGISGSTRALRPTYTGYSINWAYSKDDLQTISSPVEINYFPTRRDYEGNVAVDGLGNWCIIWRASAPDSLTTNWVGQLVSYSNNTGQSWTEPTAYPFPVPKDIVGDSRGRFLAVWSEPVPSETSDPTTAVYFTSLIPAGVTAAQEWHRYQ